MAGPSSDAKPGRQPSDRDTVILSNDRDTVTFMSYNMTGAETVKCQWSRDLEYSEYRDMELMKELRRLKSGKGDMGELQETVDGVSGDEKRRSSLL